MLLRNISQIKQLQFVRKLWQRKTRCQKRMLPRRRESLFHKKNRFYFLVFVFCDSINHVQVSFASRPMASPFYLHCVVADACSIWTFVKIVFWALIALDCICLLVASVVTWFKCPLLLPHLKTSESGAVFNYHCSRLCRWNKRHAHMSILKNVCCHLFFFFCLNILFQRLVGFLL